MKLSSYNINKIPFTANIIFNREQINDCVKNDKRVTDKGIDNINQILDEVDNFSTMEETPTVTITPYAYRNMTRLVCNVKSNDDFIWRVIPERDSKKLSEERLFADRYLTNIKNAIVQIDKEQKELPKIKDAIINSKTIVGFNACDSYCAEENINRIENGDIRKLSKEETANYFCKRILHQFDSAFNRNVNPTDRIIEIINRIDEKYKDAENYIFIGRSNKNYGKPLRASYGPTMLYLVSKFDDRNEIHKISFSFKI